MNVTAGTTFLDLPSELSDFEKSKVAILPIPYEATTTYGKGTKDGPEAIIQASTQVEFYDEELDCEPCEVGISTAQPITGFDSKLATNIELIAKNCNDLICKKKFVVGLGGEHSVTVGLTQAHAGHYEDFSVLQLDAHSDLRDSYEGSQYNHACVMARIQEICPYVGVGIRSAVREEKHRLSAGSRLFYMHEVRRDVHWVSNIIESLKKKVYITVDLDFFDPSLVPCVGTPEPGGFFWNETLEFLREVVHHKHVIGFDIVELCPKRGWPASDFLTAKLIYKLLGYVFCKSIKEESP